MIEFHASNSTFRKLPGCHQSKRSRATAFHILLNDGREAWVAIATLEILHGKIAVREIGDVLAWADSNQAMLADKFEELQQ
jgi:hypothetical protein